MSPNLEDLRQIVLSHHLASAEQVDGAEAWGSREHPDKDLAEHLFMRGVLDRQQVSLVRRLAKMSRPSARLTPRGTPRPGLEDGALEDGALEDEPAARGQDSTVLEAEVLDPDALPTRVEAPPRAEAVAAQGDLPTIAGPAPTLAGDTVLDRTVLPTPAGDQLQTGLLSRSPPDDGTDDAAAPPQTSEPPTSEAETQATPPPAKPAAKAPAATTEKASPKPAKPAGSGAKASAPAGKAAGKPASAAASKPSADGASKPASAAASKPSADGASKPAASAASKPSTDGANKPSASSAGPRPGAKASAPAGKARPAGKPASADADGTPLRTESGGVKARADTARETAPLPSARVKLEPGDPTAVGRYQILERVARGGMGVVYRARHPELDRVFALKLLTARMKNTGEAIARFQREAKLAARLDHPNVVRVYDAASDDAGVPFLVMDFVDGPDLDDVIRDEGLGVRKAAQIARSVALALQHAHERGIVHRDVKPENVILDRATGEPKLTDFGIVKDLDESSEDEKRLTRTGYTLGSPCYMSPEQAAGRHADVGPRSDVYSLAATLYEMLTGEPPFDGDSIHDIMVKVIQSDPVPVRAKNPAIPVDLEVICLKGLEKEPERRYASAAELAEDLRRFLEDEPILAKPAGWQTKAARFARRHRSAVLLGALLLLTLLGAAGFLWKQERERRRRETEERDGLLAQAEQRIGDARRAKGPLERRRALYDALLTLERVLDRAPTHERARERKREVLLTLGDQLIESGEASFAEFVFGLGHDLLDAATVSSRLEAARIGRMEEAAREREAAGELEEAVRLLRRGQAELTAAGYSGARLQERVAELEKLLDARRRRAEVERLVAQAEAGAAQGQHAQAWRTLLQALELEPESQALEAQAAHHQGKAEEAARLRLIAVEAARTQALGVLGKRAEKELPPPLLTHIAQGDALLQRARELLEAHEYLAATRELDGAEQAYAAGRRVATVLHARFGCDEAAARAEEANAARFAPRELGQARDFRARAQGAFERGRMDEAVQLFEQAATAYRLAARTGSGKESVSDAWKEAREVRARASQELSADHRLPLFDQAEDEFQQAEGAYRREDWAPARELYLKTIATFKQVLELAEATREAFSLRARAQDLRRDATGVLAERFAPDELRDADALLRDGAQALARSDPLLASEGLRKAIYKLERVVESSRPQADGLRECDALREQVVAARSVAQTQNLTWKPGYKSAEADLQEGDKLKSEGHWRPAKRRYEKALRSLTDLIK